MDRTFEIYVAGHGYAGMVESTKTWAIRVARQAAIAHGSSAWLLKDDRGLETKGTV